MNLGRLDRRSRLRPGTDSAGPSASTRVADDRAWRPLLRLRRAQAALAAMERTRHDREGGQILVLFAFSIVVILLFASIAIDLGVLRNDRQVLVNAVDAAALAGGTLMPVDGSQSGAAAAANALVVKTLNANYPGGAAPPSVYTISYRCIIGLDNATPPMPNVSQDIPAICDPSNSLGWTGSTSLATKQSAFQGAGLTRFSSCNPNAPYNDKCNTVVVTASKTTNYSFGRLVGVDTGSTGTVLSAACNGPCGNAPVAPVDLVVLIDRTASMSSADVTATRDAANAVLGVYDPTIQRVAFGVLGPSRNDAACPGSSPSVNVAAYNGNGPQEQSDGSTLGTTGGATTLVINRPPSTVQGNLLVVGITYLGGSTKTITPPSGGGNSAPNDWQLVARRDSGNTATSVGVATYYKVSGRTTGTTPPEPTSYTFTFGTSTKASGGILRYDNYDASDPIDAFSLNSGTSGTALQANAVTTPWPNEALVSFYGTAARTSLSTPGGMTEQWEAQNGTAGNAGPTISADTVFQSSAAATGNKTSTAGASAAWATQLISINNPYKVTPPSSSANRNDLAKWIPIGFTSTDTDSPAQDYNEAYSDGQGNVAAGSHVESAITCFDHPGGTGTNLTTPVIMAANYLKYYGRPHVKWGIILETDGQPNDGGNGDAGAYTCGAAVTAANNAKAITNADGLPIEVFTVGFGLDGSNDVDCPDGSGVYQNHNVTYALAAMASTANNPKPNGSSSGCVAAENTDLDDFFCEPKTSDLTAIFTSIATQFAGIRTHLVQLYPAPYISGIAPSSGTLGTSLTISGKYFTGVTAVHVGGTPVGWTFVNDTRLTVFAPGGAAGSTVDITVTTPGGTSLIVPADHFHYN